MTTTWCWFTHYMRLSNNSDTKWQLLIVASGNYLFNLMQGKVKHGRFMLPSDQVHFKIIQGPDM
jgi:hypothetical protein